MVKEQEGPPPAQASIPESPAPECDPGSHYDPEGGVCVPDNIPAEPAKVIESLPKLLRLGEPFADYADFDDCVAKNKGKVDDPNAYCADIKRKVEGETVKETHFPLLDELARNTVIHNVRTAEAVNLLNRAVAKLDREARKSKLSRQRLSIHDTKQRRNISKSIRNLPTAINKQTLATNKLRASGDAKIQVGVNKAVQTLRLTDKNIIEYTNKKLSQLATDQAKSKQHFKTEVSKLEEKLDRNKQDYEKILAVADKNAEDLQKHVKTLEERVKEQEDELKKHDCGEDEHWDGEKCVPNAPAEPTVTEKKLAEMETKLENMESKLKGTFKGHSKAVEPKGEGTGDPSKDMRASAKKRKQN